MVYLYLNIQTILYSYYIMTNFAYLLTKVMNRKKHFNASESNFKMLYRTNIMSILKKKAVYYITCTRVCAIEIH